MGLLELILCVTGILLTFAAVWRVASLGVDVENFSREFRQDAARLLELRYREGAYRRLQAVQRITETAVDSGTTTVRGVHKSIAEIPFGVLESIPEARETAKIVRETHDMISDIVYSSILGVNKVVGEYTRKTLDQRAGKSKEPHDDDDDDDEK